MALWRAWGQRLRATRCQPLQARASFCFWLAQRFSCSLHEKLQGARLGLALNSKGKILKRKEGRLSQMGNNSQVKVLNQYITLTDTQSTIGDKTLLSKLDSGKPAVLT